MHETAIAPNLHWTGRTQPEGCRHPPRAAQEGDHVGHRLVVGAEQPVDDFLFTFRSLSANDLILVKTNGGKFASETIGGHAYETLTPETMRMFAAVRDGTLPEFLMANPAFLAPGS